MAARVRMAESLKDLVSSRKDVQRWQGRGLLGRLGGGFFDGDEGHEFVRGCRVLRMRLITFPEVDEVWLSLSNLKSDKV